MPAMFLLALVACPAPPGDTADSGRKGDTADTRDSAMGTRDRYEPADIADLAWTFTADAAWEQAGFSAASAGDIDGDGLSDVLVGARGRGAVGAMTGGAYVIRGAFALVAAPLSAGWVIEAEAAGDDAGRSVSGAGDVDGDGLDDMLVGADGHDGEADDGGAAYLILGAEGGPAASLAGGRLFTGPRPGGHAGFSVAGDFDLDGDGQRDFAVGAPADAGERRVYIMLGNRASGSLGEGVVLTGDEGNAEVGVVVRPAGDVDADGVDDLVIGQPGHQGTGAAYLLLGGDRVSSLALDDLPAFTGEAGSDAAGFAVSGAGDFDGDGHDDVLVGAPGRSVGPERTGCVYLVQGSAAPASASLANAITLAPSHREDMAGQRLDGGTDLDDDGLDDVLVGVDNFDGGNEGAGVVFVVYGHTEPAPLALESTPSLLGKGDGEQVGSAVAALPDVNGDGVPDLVVGAVGMAELLGGVYVVPGP